MSFNPTLNDNYRQCAVHDHQQVAAKASSQARGGPTTNILSGSRALDTLVRDRWSLRTIPGGHTGRILPIHFGTYSHYLLEKVRRGYCQAGSDNCITDVQGDQRAGYFLRGSGDDIRRGVCFHSTMYAGACKANPPRHVCLGVKEA